MTIKHRDRCALALCAAAAFAGTAAADCSVDYDMNGILDLEDIGTFTAAFLNQSPDADLAPPQGIFDLADIGEFIEEFLDGCDPSLPDIFGVQDDNGNGMLDPGENVMLEIGGPVELPENILIGAMTGEGGTGGVAAVLAPLGLEDNMLLAQVSAIIGAEGESVPAELGIRVGPGEFGPFSAAGPGVFDYSLAHLSDADDLVMTGETVMLAPGESEGCITVTATVNDDGEAVYTLPGTPFPCDKGTQIRIWVCGQTTIEGGGFSQIYFDDIIYFTNRLPKDDISDCLREICDELVLAASMRTPPLLFQCGIDTKMGATDIRVKPIGEEFVDVPGNYLVLQVCP
jgi:hypothetical protein